MSRWFLVSIVILMVSGCAGKERLAQGDEKVYCRTHAREAAVSGSPDEEALFLNCMHLKGVHEVEVR